MFYLPARSGKTPVFLKSLLTAFFTISFLSSFAQLKWYHDNDGDGWGNSNVWQSAANKPTGYVANNLDCNDSTTSSALWQTVGNQGFSAKGVYDQIDLAIDTNGTPYVIYADSTANYKATVKKYNGTAWVTVGAAGFSSSATSSHEIVFDHYHNTPYVAFRDGSSAAVMKFDGTNWTLVGGTFASAGSVFVTSLAVDPSGVPYIAYDDWAATNPGWLTVRKYNGTSWVTLGTSGFEYVDEYTFSLAADSFGVAYIGFQDVNAKASVMKFNGTNWTYVGSPSFSSSETLFLNLVLDRTGKPYVGYSDLGNGDKATVMMYNGTSWINIGNAGFTAGVATRTSLAVDAGGTPYLTYIDHSQNFKATAARFNGTSWEKIGIQSISSAYAIHTSLALSKNGIPYAAYLESNISNKTTVRKIVIAPDTAKVQITANPGNSICAGTTVTFTATTAFQGSTPVYQWKKNGQNVGSNTNTYTPGSLANGDVITCVLTSNSPCLVSSVAQSNAINMTVTPMRTPGITLSGSTIICAGTNITYTTSTLYGGTSPTYTWLINGVSISHTGAQYTSSSVNNKDSVVCILTSNATCLTSTSDTSNSIVTDVYPLISPSVTITASTSDTICNGTPVTFTATAVSGGATPTYQWKINGYNVGTNSPTFTTNNLYSGAAVSCAMSTSDYCSLIPTAQSNAITFTVIPVVTPTVSITTSPNTTTICTGQMINFTATHTNGGGTPSFQWKINGYNTGTNSTSYASNTLDSLDIVTCEMVSSARCPSSLIAQSNTKKFTVRPLVTPAISISSNTTNTICSGKTVTFTATSSNGGTPAYQWKRNGNNVGLNSATYNTSGINNGDVISCILTSTAACATNTAAQSNVLPFTVNAMLTPTVAITANTGNVICSGTTVTFVATPGNGGNNPFFQWKLNGSNVGSNSAVYTNGNLGTGDIVTCVMTTSADCATTATAQSNAITFVTSSVVVPTVTISANAGNPVCAGTAVTFTATSANGGSNPVYQWKKNGVNVSTSLATYTDNALADKDTIMCIITSSATCTTTPTDTSNKIVVNVQATTTDVSITSNPGNTVCAGTPVTFTATTLNGGTAPVYQWQVNGTNTGTNSNTFTLATPANNDVVRCVTTSNATCIAPANNKDTSNQISMQVNPILTPSVTIAANTGNDICSGTPVTFTATPANGGTAPSYQWKLNGNNVGTNSATYSTNALANGATVTCVMTTNAACASTVTAQSNTVAFTVNPLLVPAITITTNATGAICDGTSVTYIATVTNGGPSPVYQWKINGINAGSNSSTFTSTTLANNDLVRCVLTSNATCRTVDTTGSNTIAIAVNPILTPTISISGMPGDSICAGSNVTFSSTNSNGGPAPIYTWMKNSIPVGSASSYSTTTLAQGDVITCVMTTNAVCPSAPAVTSNAIAMTVKPILTPSLVVSVSPSDTICAGTNAVFTATPTNGGTSPAYQWMINGILAGTGNSFSTLGLLNNDIVTCTMTTNAICPLATQALGNSIKMTVNPLFTPTVAITVSPNDTVCQGTMLVFTATSSNPGKTPEYQWKKNGLDIPAAAVATYTTATLANNDAITCELTVADACATAGKITSNTIAPAILPVTKPSVNAYGIKAGSDFVLVAIAANAGTIPTYQWIKNGANIPGATDSFYISSQLTNDDSLWVRISSNEPCALPNDTFSNKVFIKQVTRVEAAGRTESKFELYPNPNNGDFTVKGRLSSLPHDQTIELTVVNGLGQSVYKHTHAVTSVAIDLQLSLKSDLPPGIYYLYLADGHRNIPLRFQLQSR